MSDRSEPAENGSLPDSTPDPTAAELRQECEALIRYIARHGNLLDRSSGLETAYVALVEAVKNTDEQAMQIAYAEATRHTQALANVSGRSILDTWETEAPSQQADKRGGWLSRLIPRTWKGHRRPLSIGVWLFIVALFLQAAAGVAGRVDDPSALDGTASFFYWLAKDLSALLLAAVWGGIGSCIFLMKKLSDRLSAMSYEKSRQKGDMARIAVGAFLGVAVVEMFFSDFAENLMAGELDFGPNLAALLAGLAVKPVYGAFETLAEALAERISGNREPTGSPGGPPTGDGGKNANKGNKGNTDNES